jgi:Fic family protein
MYAFLKSHPWISFTFSLKDASPQLWMLLGEAASKCEHIAGVPLKPSTQEELHQLYLAKGVLGTTAIEGNTLSEDQVLQLLEGDLKLPPSQQYLKQEIANIVEACNHIVREEPVLSGERIQEFNRLVLQNLKLESDAIPGQYRNHSVLVGNVYRGAPSEDCIYLVERLCEWLNGPDFKESSGLKIVYAIIKAVVAHLYLAWIHPFGDGNGRTARLIEFQILVGAGVPSPAAHLLSNHYNLTRSEYYRQLHQASKSGGNILPFLQYAVSGFTEGLREQINRIREQQWSVAWENYVHDMFRNKSSKTQKRRRDLLLALSGRGQATLIQEIIKLSPQLAVTYASGSRFTLRNDLLALQKMGLVDVTSADARPRKELILAFLPWRREAEAPES